MTETDPTTDAAEPATAERVDTSMWALVEMKGFRALPGRVEEFVFAGHGFVRIHTLAGAEILAEPQSIYSMTMCSEEELRRRYERPAYPFEHAPAITSPADSDGDEYGL